MEVNAKHILVMVSLLLATLIVAPGVLAVGCDPHNETCQENLTGYYAPSPSEFTGLDDSDVLNEFVQLEDYALLEFEIKSTHSFDTDVIVRSYDIFNGVVRNEFDINNLVVETSYEEFDSKFFFDGKKSVKQEYIVINLLNDTRNLTVTILYNVNSSNVTWNGTNYNFSNISQSFIPSERVHELPNGTNLTYLEGTILYFGAKYLNFQDVTSLAYTVSAFSESGNNYLSLQLDLELDPYEEFMINSVIGWTSRLISNNFAQINDISIGDINNNSDLDVVVAGSAPVAGTQIVWYKNNGASTPSFSGYIVDTGTDPLSDIELSDINGDTDLDIVNLYEFSSVQWQENNGGSTPTFTSRSIESGLINNLNFLSVEDINDDNDMENN